LVEIDKIVGGQLRRYEFQSTRRRFFERVRKWIALISYSVATALFWGGIAAGIAKYALGLSQESAFFFCWIPASAGFAVYCYYIRHKLSRALGFDDNL
jgi:hypothetical protein